MGGALLGGCLPGNLDQGLRWLGGGPGSKAGGEGRGLGGQGWAIAASLHKFATSSHPDP